MPYPQIVLRAGMSLLSSPENPVHGLNIVPRHASSVRIHRSEGKLGQSMVLICCLAIPQDGRRIIGRSGFSNGESLPKTELRFSIAAISHGLRALWGLPSRTTKNVPIPRLIHNY